MKKKFVELYEILKLDRRNSPWSKNNTFHSRFKELESEIEEIRNALNNEDYINLKEELGDAILDLVFLSVIAEEKKLFTLDDVLNNTIRKLRRRKPWIFTNEKVTVEEEHKRWEEAKKKEKEF